MFFQRWWLREEAFVIRWNTGCVPSVEAMVCHQLHTAPFITNLYETDTKKTKTDGPSEYGDTKMWVDHICLSVGFLLFSLTSGKIRYAINSAGGICRQLADFAFMLRDYDGAQTNYKTCARDFQNDKALKHLGGTFEMIGLCSIMLEPVKKVWLIDLDHWEFLLWILWILPLLGCWKRAPKSLWQLHEGRCFELSLCLTNNFIFGVYLQG